jgi:UDP-GlcNAc:undecaprenyl-phosphate GlcNAc-1-phosphate transferase
MRTYFFLVTIAGGCCYACSLWLARMAAARGWARRSGDQAHGEGVPRLGGVAVVAAVLCAIALLLWWDNETSRHLRLKPQEGLGLLAAAGMVFLLGLYDDLRGASPWQKLVVQAAAGLVLFSAGYRIDLLTNPFTGGSLALGWLSLPLTLLWFVAICNAFNLIDGLDGLAAGIGFFASLSLFLLAVLASNPFMAAIAAALAGALLGFLPHNFSAARIYLGDSGSLTIGITLAALAVRSSMKGPVVITLAIPLMIFGLPLLDAGVTTVRRFLSGHPIFRRDEEHLHHRLLRIGMTHRAAVLALYGVAAFFALASLLLVNYRSSLAPLIALLCGVLAWMVVRQMQYPEFAELDRHVRTGLLSQRAVLRNQILLRKAAAELRAASTVAQAWEVAARVFHALEFDGATCEVVLRPGGALNLRWNAPTELRPESVAAGESWRLAIPLCVAGRRMGEVELSRALSRGPLHYRAASLLEFVADSFAARVAELAASGDLEQPVAATRSA